MWNLRGRYTCFMAAPILTAEHAQAMMVDVSDTIASTIFADSMFRSLCFLGRGGSCLQQELQDCALSVRTDCQMMEPDPRWCCMLSSTCMVPPVLLAECGTPLCIDAARQRASVFFVKAHQLPALSAFTTA
jgi:hypothetical protein